MSLLLITGVNGFVGRQLYDEASAQGWQVRGTSRGTHGLAGRTGHVIVGEIDANTDWSAALSEVEVIVHLAARVHVMRDNSADPLAEFRKVNVLGTENLARQAARAGVRRFVYVSSIKVNGEGTRDGRPYTENDVPAPQDPYGLSKWEAEQALHLVSRETGLEVVIVRPPLIYGAGVKGNFLSLLQAVEKGMPLPLSGAHNARSLLYVGNLVDSLLVCATHPAASGQTYLISDGEPVSTSTLIEKMAAALGCRSRLFYFPPVLLRLAGGMLGRSAQVDRLFGSLRIDDSKIRRELCWQPRFSLQQGLSETVKWYRENAASKKGWL